MREKKSRAFGAHFFTNIHLVTYNIITNDIGIVRTYVLPTHETNPPSEHREIRGDGGGSVAHDLFLVGCGGETLCPPMSHHIWREGKKP